MRRLHCATYRIQQNITESLALLILTRSRLHVNSVQELSETQSASKQLGKELEGLLVEREVRQTVSIPAKTPVAAG